MCLPHLPVIQGASPQLSRLAEGIWRHTGHHCGRAGLSQLKQLLVCPYISGLATHVDGHVSHNLDSMVIGVCLQRQ